MLSQTLLFVTCQWRLLVEYLYLNRYVYLVVNQNVLFLIDRALVLRLVKGVTRRDRIRNADIYDEFKIKPIIETIQTDQLRWFGHVMRRDEETTAKKVLNLKVKGKRPRGRPRTSWIKYIDNKRRKEERP